MEWISVKDRQPTKEDSPILAYGEEYNDYFFECAALHWLDGRAGWDGEGWYDHSDEYGMKEKDIKWWIPLPQPPRD